MASQEKVFKVKIDGVEKSITNVSDLKKSLSQLEQNLESSDFGSQNWKELQAEIVKTKGKIQEIDSTLDSVSSEQKAEGFKKISESLVGGFTLATVAVQNFGNTNEDIEKVTQKLLQVVLVADSIKKVTEGFTGENLKAIKSIFGMSSAFDGAGKSAKLFGVISKGAIAATGIGLLVVALGILIENWDKVNEEVKEFGNVFAGIQSSIIPTLKAIGTSVYDYLVLPAKTAFAAFTQIKSFFSGDGFDLKKIFEPLNESLERTKNNFLAIGDAYSQGVKNKILADNLELLKENEKLIKGIREDDLRLIEDSISNEKTANHERKKLLEQKRNILLESNSMELMILEQSLKLKDKVSTEEKIQLNKLKNDKILIQRSYLNDLIKINEEEAQKIKEFREAEAEFDKEQAEKRKQEKLKLEADLNALENQRTTNSVKNLQYQLKNEKINGEAKKQIIKDVYELEIQQIFENEQYKLQSLKQGTAEYKAVQEQAIQQRIDSERAASEVIVEIDKKTAEERKNKLKETTAYVQQGLGYILQAYQMANQASIDSLQADIDSKNDQLSRLEERTNESTSRIQSYEDQLKNSRGQRTKDLLKYIEQEKAAEKQATAEKIKLQKQIEAEEAKIRKKKKQSAIAGAIIGTANAVVNALGSSPPPLNFVMAALVGALGAYQIATISKTQYAKGGLLKGPSHSNGGIDGTGAFSNVQVEGGEFIVNKASTQRYLPVLESINKNKFADGGVLPTPNFSSMSTSIASSPTYSQNTEEFTTVMKDIKDLSNRPVVVTVQDINYGQGRVAKVENRSKF